MRIDFVHAGFFKLDGGAMHGVVPKAMWSRVHPPDEDNLCAWAARCLLIRTGERVILVDTGIGDKQDAKFRSHFHPHGEQTLLGSLMELGVSVEDVTDVLLTHCHFDHVGGATHRRPDGQIVTTFPNAVYWSHEDHWAWANDPNPREAASFLIENIAPLAASGQLDFLPVAGERDYHWLPGISLRALYGHTEAMLTPIVELDDGRRFGYCADLMPSAAHVRAPWVIAYDIRPLITLEEKARFCREAHSESWLIGFEHDPVVGYAHIAKDKRGRFVAEPIQTRVGAAHPDLGQRP